MTLNVQPKGEDTGFSNRLFQNQLVEAVFEISTASFLDVLHIEERVEGSSYEGENCKVSSKSHRYGTVSLTTVVVVELRFAIGVVLGVRVAVISIVICVGVVFCVVAYVSVIIGI